MGGETNVWMRRLAVVRADVRTRRWHETRWFLVQLPLDPIVGDYGGHVSGTWSEEGMMRLEPLIELKLFNSSCSSLSSYWNWTNNSLSSNSSQQYLNPLSWCRSRRQKRSPARATRNPGLGCSRSTEGGKNWLFAISWVPGLVVHASESVPS